jgi:hypothetical protein
MSSRTNSSQRYWNVWMRKKSEETFLAQRRKGRDNVSCHHGWPAQNVGDKILKTAQRKNLQVLCPRNFSTGDKTPRQSYLLSVYFRIVFLTSGGA